MLFPAVTMQPFFSSRFAILLVLSPPLTMQLFSLPFPDCAASFHSSTVFVSSFLSFTDYATSSLSPLLTMQPVLSPQLTMQLVFYPLLTILPVLSPLLTMQPVFYPLLTMQPILSPQLTMQPVFSPTDNSVFPLPFTDCAASSLSSTGVVLRFLLHFVAEKWR